MRGIVIFISLWLTPRRFLRDTFLTMITKYALPGPETIKKLVTWLVENYTLTDLAEVASENTLRKWQEGASIRVSNLVRLTAFAEKVKAQPLLEWQELVLAEDYPCVTLRDGGIEDTQYFVCERRATIKRGQLIIHEGELCEIMGLNNKQKLQAIGKFTNNIYELEKPPGHAVIGRFVDVPWAESGPDITMPAENGA